MAENFNNLDCIEERQFTSDTIDELVQLYGIPCKYLKKTDVNIDRIFGEDNLKKFENCVDIYLLPENPKQFEGRGDVFGKLGFNELNIMTMFVEIQRFKTTVGKDAPDEDDLVFIPIFGSWFQISFNKDRAIDGDTNTFFWNGVVAAFRIDLFKYQFSGERISTTDPTIEANKPTDTNQIVTDNDTVNNEEKKESLIDEFDELLK